MFNGESLNQLADFLSEKNILLFHSCQFIDFRTYKALGGIPSRDRLQNSRMEYTPFDSDKRDMDNKIWDKVFFNLSDFGNFFHNGAKSIPTVYGPISMAISPLALKDALDVSITLRSAGGKGFSREDESLTTVDEVALLIKPSKDDPKKYWAKSVPEFEADFKNKPYIKDGVHLPELNCTFQNGLCKMEHVKFMVVDPVSIGSPSLLERTKGLKVQFPVYGRRTSVSDLYIELTNLVGMGIDTIDGVLKNSKSLGLQTWARTISEMGLDYQFSRFSRYLLNGTITTSTSGARLKTTLVNPPLK